MKEARYKFQQCLSRTIIIRCHHHY